MVKLMSKGKWDFPFLDARFNRQDLDAPYLSEIEQGEALPVVFIQGLHRSGTTFLLNSLHDLYSAVSTNVYHIAFYRRLLHAEKQGEAAHYQEEISRYLARHGLRDRQIDAVPVGPQTLDEYGFIYDRLGIHRTAAWMLREIRGKLSWLRPDAGFILLKDPVSFTSLTLLRAAVPDAKFVFIHRNPQRVLDSFVRAQLTRYEKFHNQDPYMALLMGRKARWNEVLVSYLVPRSMFRRRVAAGIAGRIRSEIAAYLRERPYLPPECCVDVEYERLVDDTETTLGRIVDHIGVEPERPLDTVVPEPRPAAPLHPDLVPIAENLGQSLTQMGYSYE